MMGHNYFRSQDLDGVRARNKTVSTILDWTDVPLRKNYNYGLLKEVVGDGEAQREGGGDRAPVHMYVMARGPPYMPWLSNNGVRACRIFHATSDVWAKSWWIPGEKTVEMEKEKGEEAAAGL